MKPRQVKCPNSKCKHWLTTKKAKGEIISCSGCKRKFVEEVK